jgi:hypothetical protein
MAKKDEKIKRLKTIMNKKGEIGEFILMMYRLVLISISALVLLGVSALVYSYDINVRNSEAEILNVQVVNCLAENPSLFYEEDKSLILTKCGFLGDKSRYFVKVSVVDLIDREIFYFYEGDSGVSWVEDLEKQKKELKRYSPGYSKRTYDVDLNYFDDYYKRELESHFGGEIRLVVEVYIHNE